MKKICRVWRTNQNFLVVIAVSVSMKRSVADQRTNAPITASTIQALVAPVTVTATAVTIACTN